MTALYTDPYADPYSFAKAAGWEGQIVPFPGEDHFRTVTVRDETVTVLVALGLGGYYAPVNDKGQILVRPPQVGDLLHYLPDILGWMGQPTKLRPEALLTPGWAKTWPGKYTDQNLREVEERRAAREAKAVKPTSAASAPAAPSPAQVGPVKAKVSFGSPSPSSSSPALDSDSGPFSVEGTIDMHDTGVVQPSVEATAPPAPAAPVKAKVSFGSPSPSPSPSSPAAPPVLDPIVDESGLWFLRRAEITWDQWFQEVVAFAEGEGNPSLIAHGLAAGLPLVRPTDPNRVDFRKSKFTAPLGRPPGS
jgi:hypothetical protein